MITLECELGIRILIVPSPFCLMPSGSVHCRLQRRSLVTPMGVEGGDEEEAVHGRCFASLLHGDQPEYLAFACVLGRRLSEESPGTRRILLCGPGKYALDPAAQQALQCAGWQDLYFVPPIVAGHLDKTRAGRHALVFTKLRVLELPCEKVLLLDLDLLPRKGVDPSQLFDVESPAAKYHSARHPRCTGQIIHGSPIPGQFLEGVRWCPNAGVVRFDPLRSSQSRRAQVADMERDIAQRREATYLPEQYYLAERFTGWRHIRLEWNFEVWPELDDPGFDEPTACARVRAQESGWAGYYNQNPPPSGADVLQGVQIWHFSGISRETAPWVFMDEPTAERVRVTASGRFRNRDPSGVVATALSEWRGALDDMLRADHGGLAALREAVAQLAARAREEKQTWWRCEVCGVRSSRVRQSKSGVPRVGLARELWLCADCAVAPLRSSRSGSYPMRATPLPPGDSCEEDGGRPHQLTPRESSPHSVHDAACNCPGCPWTCTSREPRAMTLCASGSHSQLPAAEPGPPEDDSDIGGW